MSAVTFVVRVIDLDDDEGPLNLWGPFGRDEAHAVANSINETSARFVAGVTSVSAPDADFDPAAWIIESSR